MCSNLKAVCTSFLKCTNEKACMGSPAGLHRLPLILGSVTHHVSKPNAAGVVTSRLVRHYVLCVATNLTKQTDIDRQCTVMQTKVLGCVLAQSLLL